MVMAAPLFLPVWDLRFYQVGDQATDTAPGRQGVHQGPAKCCSQARRPLLSVPFARVVAWLSLRGALWFGENIRTTDLIFRPANVLNHLADP